MLRVHVHVDVDMSLSTDVRGHMFRVSNDIQVHTRIPYIHPHTQRKLKEKEEAEKAKLIQREEEMAKTDPIFRYGNELRKQREVARMKKEIEDKKEALSCALGPHQARKVIEPNPFSMKLKEKKRVEGMSTREQNKLKARYIQESGTFVV